MSSAGVVLGDIRTTADGKLPTVDLDELILASASSEIASAHLPLLKPAKSNIFPKKDVESSVDVSERLVANKEDSVESVEYHADLCRAIPAIVTS